MKIPPKIIDGANLILYSPNDERHRHTGNCKQIVAGELMEAANNLAICQYDSENCFYLFGCDENWNVVTDTWHETIEDAKKQAEFEYEGISNTWQKL